jgi:hypothetical protein
MFLFEFLNHKLTLFEMHQEFYSFEPLPAPNWDDFALAGFKACLVEHY